jgi:phosphate transport system substrate-binding protein
MKNKLGAALLSTIVLMFAGCGNSSTTATDTPTSGNITISVDESFQPIIESQINTFEGIYKRANVSANYKSEGEVMKDLLNDSTKIAVLSRELTADEKAVFDKKKLVPRVTKIAIDAIAFILHRNNPDSLITVQQLQDIFSGRVSSWKQINKNSNLKDITIVFDNNNSSTARYITDSLITGSKLPQNTFATKSHEALIEYVEQNENAIGVLGVNWISDQDDSKVLGFLNRIRVAGISANNDNPTSEDYFQPYQGYIAQGTYPLRRYLYIISVEGRAGLGTGFASYVAGDKGQRIILKSGLVPATMPVRVIGVR